MGASKEILSPVRMLRLRNNEKWFETDREDEDTSNEIAERLQINRVSYISSSWFPSGDKLVLADNIGFLHAWTAEGPDASATWKRIWVKQIVGDSNHDRISFVRVSPSGDKFAISTLRDATH